MYQQVIHHFISYLSKKSMIQWWGDLRFLIVVIGIIHYDQVQYIVYICTVMLCILNICWLVSKIKTAQRHMQFQNCA